MRRLLFCIFLLTPILLSARTPEWVNSKPNNSLYYWGIGVCELSNTNYKDVAKREALEEITQQISITVESNSFLSIRETNLDIQEDFQQNIKMSSQVYLEDLQIYDSYQDKKNYYVCYRLNKDEYKARCTEKSNEVAKSAFAYLQKALEAETNGNLMTAIEYYQKGLEIVEPWLFLDLIYMSQNIPIVLYSGLMSIFNDLTISIQPESTTIRNLKSVNMEIVVTLNKRNTPIRDFTLNAHFQNGMGKITPSAKTNMMGEGRFFLTGVSSKETLQSILFTINNDVFANLSPIYQNKTTYQQMPQALFIINIEQQNAIFYINNINQTLPSFHKQVNSILSQNYLNVTTNLEEATHIIDIATNLHQGGKINGDLEDLDEWLADSNISIKTKDGSVLTNYSEDGIRILVAKGSSQTVVTQQAAKELLKRFKREFPKQLTSLNIL